MFELAMVIWHNHFLTLHTCTAIVHRFICQEQWERTMELCILLFTVVCSYVSVHISEHQHIKEIYFCHQTLVMTQTIYALCPLHAYIIQKYNDSRRGQSTMCNSAFSIKCKETNSKCILKQICVSSQSKQMGSSLSALFEGSSFNSLFLSYIVLFPWVHLPSLGYSFTTK